jgi:adenylate cyclase
MNLGRPWAQFKDRIMTKTQIYKLIFLVCFWEFAAIFFEFFQGTIQGFSSTHDFKGIPYSFHTSLISAIIMTFVGSIFLVMVQFLYIDKFFRKTPLGITLLAKTAFYLFNIFFFSSFAILLNDSINVDRPIYHSEVLAMYFNYLNSPKVILIMLYWSIAVMSALFILHINEHLGRGVMINFLRGKYHRPREEVRIFMFLDLTSSARIAEELGTHNYSSFLQDFFYDLDDAIVDTKGSVFQFVGDEVVIIWNLNDGLERNNCIRLFFLAQEKIKYSETKYLEKYGTSPDFKAGAHYGKVIITEVGGSKHEIAYHGDTINSTARIRSVCKEVNSNLLISAELLSILSNIDNEFFVESKGIFNFKGKKNVIGLFSVEEKNEKYHLNK